MVFDVRFLRGIVFILCTYSICVSNTTLSEMTELVSIVTGIGTGHVSAAEEYHYNCMLPYQTGGITFVFPADLFTQEPLVLITVCLMGRSYSPTEMLTAELVAISSQQVTVRVHVSLFAEDPPAIFEATNGYVDVYLQAIGT